MGLQQTRPIRVLLVDDHQHVLWGLGRLIEGEGPHMEVAGTARTVSEALTAVREAQPDVVLLDICLGEENSLDYLPRFLETKGMAVLVLTGTGDAELHQRAVEGGAWDVIKKGEPAEVLLEKIERAYSKRNEQRPAS